MSNKSKPRVVKVVFSSLLFLRSIIAPFEWAKAEESRNPSSFLIEADSYCAFLNSEERVDYNDLFDDQMAGHAPSAFLQRFGVPGSYHYEVIPGKEKTALPYLNKIAVVSYSEWKEQLGEHDVLSETLTSCSPNVLRLDPALKSNGLFFALVRQNTSVSSGNDVWEHFCWQEKAAIEIAGILVIAAFAQSIKDQLEDEKEMENRAELLLGRSDRKVEKQQATKWKDVITSSSKGEASI